MQKRINSQESIIENLKAREKELTIENASLKLSINQKNSESNYLAIIESYKKRIENLEGYNKGLIQEYNKNKMMKYIQPSKSMEIQNEIEMKKFNSTSDKIINSIENVEKQLMHKNEEFENEHNKRLQLEKEIEVLQNEKLGQNNSKKKDNTKIFSRTQKSSNEIEKTIESEKELKKLVIQNDLLIQEKKILEDKIKKLEYSKSGENLNSTEKAMRELIENLKMEIKNYKDSISESKAVSKDLEEQLIKAKVEWAKSDEAKEKALYKLQEHDEIVRGFTSKVSKLEAEVVKTKQQLGEALNANIEFEQMNQTKL